MWNFKWVWVMKILNEYFQFYFFSFVCDKSGHTIFQTKRQSVACCHWQKRWGWDEDPFLEIKWFLGGVFYSQYCEYNFYFYLKSRFSCQVQRFKCKRMLRFFYFHSSFIPKYGKTPFMDDHHLRATLQKLL